MLREASLEPDELDIDNPFFNPAIKMPEGRGLLWGGLLGGFIRAVLLFMMDQNIFWIPRISPILTTGQYMLIFLGSGSVPQSVDFLEVWLARLARFLNSINRESLSWSRIIALVKRRNPPWSGCDSSRWYRNPPRASPANTGDRIKHRY